ncbi:hypothetical protein ACS5PN_03810 [Roseateles sp. NT4]|uniref:hypothetical protein n=1 Tax=Roseateles sp. NT4 TaxID=3453715 RepID=UPI003EEAAD10
MKLNLGSSAMLLGLGVLAVGAIGLMAWSKGGLGNLAKSAAGSAVDAAGGAVSGAVGAISTGVGIPTPDETTTDPAVARWVIDRAGYWEASKWCGVPALLSAMTMEVGSGKPPPNNSALARAFGVLGGYIDFGTGDGW